MATLPHSDVHTLSGGGTRSEKAPSYHLMPMNGVRRTALRFALGAEKHGAWNWVESIKNEDDAYSWSVEAYNHMIEHATKMAQGIDPTDDHLGAIGWAQTVLSFIEDTYKKRWTELSQNKPLLARVPNVA